MNNPFTSSILTYMCTMYTIVFYSFVHFDEKQQQNLLNLLNSASQTHTILIYTNNIYVI